MEIMTFAILLLVILVFPFVAYSVIRAILLGGRPAGKQRFTLERLFDGAKSRATSFIFALVAGIALMRGGSKPEDDNDYMTKNKPTWQFPDDDYWKKTHTNGLDTSSGGNTNGDTNGGGGSNGGGTSTSTTTVSTNHLGIIWEDWC